MTPFGTWLHVAASAGNIEIVKYLVSVGADVNKCGGIPESAPIDHAASEGHGEIVNYLLTQSAEINVSDPEKNPLFGAIYGGHLDIVKLLVERGIDVHVKYTKGSMKGMDAVAFARERGQVDIAEFLEGLA
jgi:ankyrin repeat protein